MSKDIWHKADEIPDFDKSYVELSRSLQGDLVYSTWGHPNYITPNTIKWCYMDDLLALENELERTRKALDVAVDALKEIDELLSSNRFDVKEVPLLNITQTKISMLLKCINIEQKESAFMHNKIEFPEYNDNLLEEFDKQFFENGQDDDLTETALEQKDK